MIRFATTRLLPADVAAAVIPGASEVVVLVADDADPADIVNALNDVLPQTLGAEWLYVGPVGGDA